MNYRKAQGLTAEGNNKPRVYIEAPFNIYLVNCGLDSTKTENYQV